jgi:uncharacterized membrane protein
MLAGGLMSLRRLKAWEAAGLVDATTAARIRDWESAHASPVAMRAVIGIAALAIGLGLVSLIAANWDAVPGVVRLGIHFALLVALAFWLWRKTPTGGIAAEAGLFVLGMLGLTFFGHIGQVYQTDSPLWQPLALWLLLFAPSVLLRGTGWLTALLLMAVMIAAAWSRAWAWSTRRCASRLRSPRRCCSRRSPPAPTRAARARDSGDASVRSRSCMPWPAPAYSRSRARMARGAATDTRRACCGPC